MLGIATTSLSPDTLMQASTRVRAVMDGLKVASTDHEFADFDEAFIFLSLGALNLDSYGETTFIRSWRRASLSKHLHVPQETLRRKLWSLQQKGLVAHTSDGFVIADMQVWMAVARMILS